MVSYPGNKQRHNFGVKWSGEVFDFYFGTGGFSRATTTPDAVVYGAEANPMMRAIMANGGDTGFYHDLQAQCDHVAKALKARLDPAWNGKGTYSELYPESYKSIRELWIDWVKMPWDRVMLHKGTVDLDALAAQVMIGTYAYAGNIRASGNGLNSPFNAQKLRSAKPVLPKPLRVKHLEVVSKASVLEPTPGSLCLVDPMYWLPMGFKHTHQRCTSCYTALVDGVMVPHNPYAPSGLQDYLDPIAKSLKASAAKVIVTGYYSGVLDWQISELASQHGYSCTCTEVGPLTRQTHRHRLRHGNRSVGEDLPGLSEHIWTLAIDLTR